MSTTRVDLGGGLQAERHPDGRLSLSAGAWALQLDGAQVAALVKLLAPPASRSRPSPADGPIARPAQGPLTLNPAEAAAYIGIGVATYYRYVHPAVQRREIECLIIGRQRRIITTSLDAWVARQADDAPWGRGTKPPAGG